MEIIIDNKLIRTLKSGDAFGEMALLYNAPRSASIKSKSKYDLIFLLLDMVCGFWGLER